MNLPRPMTNQLGPRALVLLRVARGAAPPTDDEARRALGEDRRRISAAAGEVVGVGRAGPYAIVVDGVELDEYVAWEA